MTGTAQRNTRRLSHDEETRLQANHLSGSELAKRDHEGTPSEWPEPRHPFFRELFGVIQDSVANDRFASPMSDFHESEGSLSSELAAHLQGVDNALSRGLTFNSWFSICHAQLISAASSFAGIELPSVPWWHIPFNRDPDILDKDLRAAKAGMSLHFRFISLIAEQRRLRNEVEPSMYRDYKEERKSVGLLFEDEVSFSRGQLIWEGYLGVLNALNAPGVISADWDMIYRDVAADREHQWREIEGIVSQSQNPTHFLTSPDFDDVHFINIRSQLMAADIVKFPARKPESSLHDDLSIAATVLPYSDVFATDSYIAELIRQTKLDNYYSCRVFTMRRREEFLNQITELKVG